MKLKVISMTVATLFSTLAFVFIQPNTVTAHPNGPDGISHYYGETAAPRKMLLCNRQESWQNHASQQQPGMVHIVKARLRGEPGVCVWELTVGAGHLAMRGSVYRDGQLCVAGGWIYNQAPAKQLRYVDNTDWAKVCGNGLISHRLTTAVYNGSNWGWLYHERFTITTSHYN